MKTLFYGGTVLTMEEPLYAEAVLVEDGKIAAVGETSALWHLADTHTDLCGATMLPGFIDAHSHLTEYAVTLTQVPLGGIGSFADMKTAIQSYIAEHKIPEGEWVVCRNYDDALFPEHKHPTLEEIDSIAPGHKLLIKHCSGHMGLVNSYVLRQYGITPDTPVPAGGRIVTEQGKMTGALEEGALSMVRSHVPPVSLETACAAHKKIQRLYASYGITTAQDGYLSSRMIEIYKALYEKGEIGLDIRSYTPKAHYENLDAQMAALPAGIPVRHAGIKYFLDGSPQLRTAWVRTPYLGGGRGTQIHSDEEVTEAFRFAARHHAQMLVHANGDAAIAQFLRCLEAAAKEYPESVKLRHVIVHGQLMGADQLAKAKELGVIVSFFVAHTYHFADTHIRNLGKERGYAISPTLSALNAGVRFTFHQDAPVIEPDMPETVWCAVNRVTRAGVRLAGEEIPVLDALRAVTVHAAYQYFEENEKGSLAPGKAADFILLDKNPLTVPKETVREIRVLKTYKNGKLIFEREQ